MNLAVMKGLFSGFAALVPVAVLAAPHAAALAPPGKAPRSLLESPLFHGSKPV